MFALAISSGTIAWGLVALLAAYLIVGRLINLNVAVDEDQEAVAKLGGILASAQFKRGPEICAGISAVSIKQTIKRIRDLVASIQDEESLLKELRPNFEWQLAKRLAKPEERAKILEAVEPFLETVEVEE